MKKEHRRLLLALLRSAGLFAAWRRLHGSDIAILMLHGTADPGRPSRWAPLRPQFSPGYIDWCLGVIGSRHRFISLERAVDILKGKAAPVRNGIAVTLDDGYRSNIADALPVFRKRGVPVAIFLTVAHVDARKPLWFDRLDYALQAAGPGERTFDIGGGSFRFSGDGRETLAASYASFRERIKRACPDEDDFQSKVGEVIAHFERAGGRSLGEIFEEDPWSALLDWDEIRGHRGEDVLFGSHTMDHYRVGRLEGRALRRQLRESKSVIEEKTGTPCRYIAYPDGDCTELAGIVARESGYEAGVTTEEGINRIGCDCMALRRICLPWTTDPTELLARVSGLSEALSRRFSGKGVST